MWKFLVALSVVGVWGSNAGAAGPAAPACLSDRSPDRLRVCAGVLEGKSQFPSAVQVMQKSVQLNPSASNWRYLGELAVKAENYDVACTSFKEAIRRYQKLDVQAALFLSQTRGGYCQDVELYTLEGKANPTPKLAKFEPKSGILLGLSSFPKDLRANGGKLPALEVFGGPLAVYLTYYPLIEPSTASSNLGIFPREVAAAAKAAGAAIHIALEPKMPLSQITEATLIPFAEAARNAELPIFLRFASEFNDSQNEWSKNPALYVQKFRLLHTVMARIAPNVAMVWMPYANGSNCFEEFYPGERYVDWVGVSLYSVPFLNGNPALSGEMFSPLERIEGLYRCYADRHPFQVSEYASSSRNVGLGDRDYCDFASRKMRDLYWGAALKLPRLKNINWLDLDMGGGAANGKAESRQNDYRLLAVPCKLETFKTFLQEPYFLRRFPSTFDRRPAPLPPLVTAGLRGAAYLKIAKPVESVDYLWNGKKLSSAKVVPYAFSLPKTLKPGTYTLELRVFGAGGKVLLSKVQKVGVR
ncbi:MAG: hypothetical protein H7095_08050 [Pseudopedobacter sp.]|nr:hypothetical protein [Deinococcales bacterium]